MSAHTTYQQRRGEIETYFDRTAAAAWEQLTSTAPVGRIRATVRAGRDRMRELLLGRLPADLRGARLLDAGCGTGALAMEAARRGAQVVAIDLSPALVDVARRRLAEQPDAAALAAHIHFTSGDMADVALGRFDHAVAMDSLIHYALPDAVRVLEAWALRVSGSMLFTFAPASPLLTTMHAVGRLFPRSDRSPSLQPVAEAALRRQLAAQATVGRWRVTHSARVASGFYTSQSMELQP
jgi:magnesium-protoporphyrin O-methyltransferase